MAIGLNNGTIRRALAKHMGKFFRAGGVLVKVTPGTRGATLTAGTNPTEASYPCKVWVAKYSTGEMAGTSIRYGDDKVSILGGTLPAGVVPAPNDKITFDGVTYRILGEGEGGMGVSADTDRAVFRCHCRA